jgi:hypothetical protein
MRVPPDRMTRRSRRSGLLAALVLLSLQAACSGDGSTSVDTTAAVYVGSFAAANISGTVSFTLAANATGTMKQLNGTTTALTGTYVASTGAVSLSGGGSSFTGTLANGVLAGSFSSGNTSGGKFTAALKGTGSTDVPPKSFCGSYVTNTDYGWLNLVVSSTGTVSGFAVSGTNGPSVTITGTATSTALTATTSASLAISGTLSSDGTTYSGSYQPSGAVAGGFLASTATCGTSSGVTSSNSIAGYWGGNPALSTTLNVVFTQNGTTLGGGGAIHTTLVTGYTGDFFRITSGSFNNPNITFTADLGANPAGNGLFYIGSLSFTGTMTSSTSATGTLTYTPPRLATVVYPLQTVTGVTITR